MIRLELPSLPPSSNHAYFNLKGRGRALTDVGRSYLTNVKSHLQRNHRQAMTFFEKNAPYFVVVRFYFGVLENAGYPGKAENRYKKLDGNNRIKLLEDALKDAGGIDDSQTLRFLWEKKQGVPERTLLWVWNLEKEKSPFDDALRTL